MGSAFIPSSNTPTAGSANVTSSSGVVLQNNSTVRYRCFKNNSQTVAMWLGLGVPAVVGVGICIEPRDTYEMSFAAQNMYPGEIFGVSEGANLTCATMEQAPNT